MRIDAAISRTGGWRRVLVYDVRGELDASAASAVDSRCRCRADRVVVGLSYVTLIDSAGSRLVERLAASTLHAGFQFAVRDPSPIVRQVFDTLDISVDADHRAPAAQESPER